jgi:CHAT domain-containing protein
LGDYPTALNYYDQSLALQRELGNRTGEANTLNNIGLLLETQNQPQLAVVFFKESVNTYEAIRADNETLDPQLQDTYTATVENTYRSLADLLIAEGRFLEALQVLELLKAEEIREYTRSTVTNDQTGEIQLSPAEAEVADTLNDLLTLGLKIDDCENQVTTCSFDDVEALYADRTLLTQQYNQVVAALEVDDAVAPDPGSLITEGVAEVLEAQPNTILIYPVVQSDRLVLLWVTRGGVASAIEVPQATKAAINRVAFEFRQLMRQCEISGCSAEDIPAIQAVAQQLHQWLIPQDFDTVLQEEGIENLAFALDQQLRYIPMAALYDGEQYLVERYTLSTVTAAWLTPVANPLPTNPAEVSVLALGLSEEVQDNNPDDDVPYFAALNHVPLELDSIVQEVNANDPNGGVYPGQSLLNSDFSDRAFSRIKFGGYQILHIATHGMFVPTDLNLSYLMLGDRTDWRISEIQNIQQQFTDLSLVVLSACETALGGPQQSAEQAQALDGREIAGIAQTFLDAGADAILASLWKVSDASTSALMQQFYLELAKGTEANPVTFSVALQRAQVRLLTGDVDPAVAETLNRGSAFGWGEHPNASDGDAAATLPDVSHPFYWAPFILIGNGL